METKLVLTTRVTSRMEISKFTPLRFFYYTRPCQCGQDPHTPMNKVQCTDLIDSCIAVCHTWAPCELGALADVPSCICV